MHLAREIEMLRSTGFIAIFLIFNTCFADRLCDTGCSLDIDFPTGGYIQAVNDLTIIFGQSGMINTVATTIGFVDRDILVLHAGERLLFSQGGSFNLGKGGNLLYSHLIIQSDGKIQLSATGGTRTLFVSGGSSFVISGKARIEFDAEELILEGTLTRVDGE
jgi:hypothetical protein